MHYITVSQQRWLVQYCYCNVLGAAMLGCSSDLWRLVKFRPGNADDGEPRTKHCVHIHSLRLRLE